MQISEAVRDEIKGRIESLDGEIAFYEGAIENAQRSVVKDRAAKARDEALRDGYRSLLQLEVEPKP